MTSSYFDRGDDEFQIDDLNMLTFPLSYISRNGLLVSVPETFQCAYRVGQTDSARFPANPANVSALLLDPPRAVKTTSQLMIRLEDRLDELERKRNNFALANLSKLTGSAPVRDGFEFRGVFFPLGYRMDPVDPYPSPAPGKIALYRQQTAAATLLDAEPRALLAMQQRTGKSFTVLAAAREKFRRGEIDCVFVLAPRSLLDTAWRFDRVVAFPDRNAIILAGDKDREEFAANDYEIALSTFESAHVNWHTVCRQYSAKRVFVICDESIKIKSPRARRTLGTLGVCLQAGYVALLSGAPVSRNYADIWSQMFAVDPGLLGDNYDAFELHFIQCDIRGRESWRKGMKEHYDYIASHAIFRCTRGEAEQFSGRDTVTRNVKLRFGATQQFVYEQMVHTFMAQYTTGEDVDLQTEATNILVQLLRLREICGGFFSYEWAERCYARIRLPENPKLEWIRKYLDEHEGTQAIIFCEFDEEERQICDLLDELGVTYGGHEAVRRSGKAAPPPSEEDVLRVAGELADAFAGKFAGLVKLGMIKADERSVLIDMFRDAAERQLFERNNASGFSATVEDFQNGDRQIFVGKHSSIGHGITLSAADAAIFYNLGFNSDNYDQARMRPVAGGKCAIIYHLMIDGSIEPTKIYPTLKRRGDMKDDVLNDAKRRGYYSFFEDILSATEYEKIAQANTAANDPLENEARRVVGYDGALTLRDFDTWLYSGESNDTLSRIESMRGVGSIRTAYRTILKAVHPDTCERNGFPLNIATQITMATIAAMKSGDDDKSSALSWNEYIGVIRKTLSISAGERLASDDPLFDAYIAYLRAKCKE